MWVIKKESVIILLTHNISVEMNYIDIGAEDSCTLTDSNHDIKLLYYLTHNFQRCLERDKIKRHK